MKAINLSNYTNAQIEALINDDNASIINALNMSSFEHRKSYFGNGKNATRGELYNLTITHNGHVVNFIKRVVVYSYRWHKAVWSYKIDGQFVRRNAIWNLI